MRGGRRRTGALEAPTAAPATGAPVLGDPPRDATTHGLCASPESGGVCRDYLQQLVMSTQHGSSVASVWPAGTCASAQPWRAVQGRLLREQLYANGLAALRPLPRGRPWGERGNSSSRRPSKSEAGSRHQPFRGRCSLPEKARDTQAFESARMKGTRETFPAFDNTEFSLDITNNEVPSGARFLNFQP